MTRSVDYDHIANTYDRRYQESDYSGVEAALNAFIGEPLHQRVLEVGCGTGHWLQSIAGRDVRAIGVDVSAQMLARRPYVTIVRCDERRVIELNDAARTFASSNIEMISDGLRRLRSSSGAPPGSSGASVNITIDVVETGGRRQLGSHVAHHVITTTTTDAAPEANARSGVLLQDAWYIDVPPARCIDWGDHPPMLLGSVVRAGSVPDRVHVDRRGTTPRGFVVEETTRAGSGEPRPTERVTLIQYSEATLDRSMFAIPESYRPALPRLGGGFDLARTDTIANRLREYWEELASWAHDLWF
jgi:hypothetical protein